MGVGKREHRQEGNRLVTSYADTAPDLNPVMVFVMGLFPSTAMTDHCILLATGAATNNLFCASFRPIVQLALRCGK